MFKFFIGRLPGASHFYFVSNFLAGIVGGPSSMGGPLGKLEFPTFMQLKIIGPNDKLFVSEISGAVSEVVEVKSASVKEKGKWCSVTLGINVQSQEELQRIYDKVDENEKVKFKL